jgi:hypothetical protein
MAGRYQGRHTLIDATGAHRSIEVFWQANGWFWQRCQLREVVGPFTTSTEAYESAKLSGANSARCEHAADHSPGAPVIKERRF